jgi:hypothetical protein
LGQREHDSNHQVSDKQQQQQQQAAAANIISISIVQAAAGVTPTSGGSSGSSSQTPALQVTCTGTAAALMHATLACGQHRQNRNNAYFALLIAACVRTTWT